jgi:hypothetical protein
VSRTNGEGVPSPAELDVEIRELITALRALRPVYVDTYTSSMWAVNGADVKIAHPSGNGHSSPTEQALAHPVLKRQRAACRSSVALVRQALEDVREAKRLLSGDVVQPRKVDRRALVTQDEFDEALHRRREEALRS